MDADPTPAHSTTDPPTTDDGSPADRPVETMDVPQGSFTLEVHPPRPRMQLRAWDAADTYVLQHLAESCPTASRVLVVGDRAGAVAVALAADGVAVTSMSDSVLSLQATRRNLGLNGITTSVEELPSTADLTGDAVPAPFDVVVVKVPRSLAMLEDQLRRIRSAIGPDTTVVGAGMTRHIHTSTLEVFTRILGTTTTSLARRKARLIHCVPDLTLDPGPSPFPSTYTLDGGLTIVSHAGVFSQGRLDIGTRMLLANLPDTSRMTHAVDLGCGDGAVGATLARANPDLHLTFLDESYMAIRSARETMAANLPDRADVLTDAGGGADTYLMGDGMDPVPDASVDLVVVNPPFHDDHAMGDAIAWHMFTGARRALRPGGRLVVVGNRHLAYHAKLARLFGGSTTVASDTKFVVLSAQRKEPRQ